jgi:HEPN domain-containing protein
MLERYEPDDPREWINRANSSLVIAKKESDDVYLEDLCYQAQQAVEKAIKALLVKYDVKFPYIHDIAKLLVLLSEAGLDIPEYIRESERLTPYASITRYPSVSPPVEKEDYYKFIEIAERVVHWVENIINQ